MSKTNVLVVDAKGKAQLTPTVLRPGQSMVYIAKEGDTVSIHNEYSDDKAAEYMRAYSGPDYDDGYGNALPQHSDDREENIP